MKIHVPFIAPALRPALAAATLLAIAITPARASLFQYSATLTGPNESPANTSPGTGFATANYDDAAHTLALDITFSGLTGTTTASHIHAATTTPLTGTAGVATTTPTFANFPLNVTSGHYMNVLDLTSSSSYNPSYVTAHGGTTAGAEAALTSAMAAGEAYLNIHTSTFGGGEIRGFLVAVPEPSTVALMSIGGLAMAWFMRRRKSA